METIAERTTAERRTADLLFGAAPSAPVADPLSQMPRGMRWIG